MLWHECSPPQLSLPRKIGETKTVQICCIRYSGVFARGYSGTLDLAFKVNITRRPLLLPIDSCVWLQPLVCVALGPTFWQGARSYRGCARSLPHQGRTFHHTIPASGRVLRALALPWLRESQRSRESLPHLPGDSHRWP